MYKENDDLSNLQRKIISFISYNLNFLEQNTLQHVKNYILNLERLFRIL
jgi:hypothetical protein